MSKRKPLNSERKQALSGEEELRNVAAEIRSAPQSKRSINTNGKRRIPAPSGAAPLISLTAALAPSSTASSNLSKKDEQVVHEGPEPQPSGHVDLGLPLPDRYGFDRLVALARDPRIVYTYWELDGDRMNEVRDARGQEFIDACAWVLRCYRLNEGVAVDMEIDPSIGNWYVEVGGPGRYQVELALMSPDGEWITLLVSQVVITPLLGPSAEIDEEWRMRPEDEEALNALLAKLMGQDQEAEKRGNSNFLGSSRIAASFGVVSSMAFVGSSFSGRPVAGSWMHSMLGSSERVPGSGASGGSGGFGWIVAPTGVHEPQLDRPTVFNGGPNWNTQDNLPRSGVAKTQQPHFKIKLPRRVVGVIPGKPTWPPAGVKLAPALARALSAKR